MSLALAPSIPNTPWAPRSRGRHRAETTASAVRIPLSVSAAVLAGTIVSAQIAPAVSAVLTDTHDSLGTDTGQIDMTSAVTDVTAVPANTGRHLQEVATPGHRVSEPAAIQRPAQAARPTPHRAVVHTVRPNAFFAQFGAAGARTREKNAALIVTLGKKRGLSDYSIAIAVATAIQESNLFNIDGGDRDSLGLFQQRPSMGWGSVKQILNPTYATNTFYNRLVSIKNRDSRSMMYVAAQIQIPNLDDYRARWRWDSLALAIVKSYR